MTGSGDYHGPQPRVGSALASDPLDTRRRAGLLLKGAGREEGRQRRSPEGGRRSDRQGGREGAEQKVEMRGEGSGQEAGEKRACGEKVSERQGSRGEAGRKGEGLTEHIRSAVCSRRGHGGEPGFPP